ncbi:MAG: type II toxin-antitoxin system HipA family toxin [Gallionella sp.]
MNAPKQFDIEKLFNKIRQLEIHTPQGVSGQLTKENRYIFNYAKVNDNVAVSLTMPVREESYSSGDLIGVFAMNRPEGYLRYIIEDRLKRLGAPSDMFLLFLAGSNQIGRLTYALPGEGLPQSSGEHLKDLLSSPSGTLFKRLVDQYALGSGISGIQPKALVPIVNDGTVSSPAEHTVMPLKTIIVKAEGDDYPGLARNEFFCMSVAKEAGFDVPEFWLSDDGLLFLMSRFDRMPDGTALGFEDMAVLTGRTDKEKYVGSYEMIALAVEKYTGDDSVKQLRRLFERVVLSCWLRDGDAHLKNFGILYEQPTSARRLAPIYDVVCTDVYPELDGLMALKLDKSKTFPSNKAIIKYGNRLGVSEKDVAEILNRIENAYNIVLSMCEKDPRFLTDDLLTRLKKEIKRI